MTGEEVLAIIAEYREAVQAAEDWQATEGAEYERRRTEVYGKRKAARARLAAALQEAGLTGFSIRDEL